MNERGPERAGDGRARRGRRRARDPGLLRHRLRVRSRVPVTPAIYDSSSPCSSLGIFGIKNDGVNTAVNVLLLVLVVVWFALIFWTYADARRRIDDPMLVACATAASLFPFVGHDRLPDRAPAGVRRRRAPARAGDDRRRGAARAARLPAVPALRLRDQGGLPALSELHAASSRSAATRAASRSTRRGSCARTARPRCRPSRRRRPRAGAAAGRRRRTSRPWRPRSRTTNAA